MKFITLSEDAAILLLKNLTIKENYKTWTVDGQTNDGDDALIVHLYCQEDCYSETFFLTNSENPDLCPCVKIDDDNRLYLYLYTVDETEREFKIFEPMKNANSDSLKRIGVL